MTSKNILKASAKTNKKAAAWIRKAGGMDAISEEMAKRIVKICKLKGEKHEKSK